MKSDLELLSKLKEKDLARQGLMVLEGRLVIEKALESGIVPRFIVCTEAERLHWEARLSSVALYVMPHDELCQLVDFKFHRGALAVADMPDLQGFEAAGAGVGQRLYLCLWGVTDPSNLGALIRTAAGLGADGILLGPGCANPFYRKALRASMGTVFRLPVWKVDRDVIAACAKSGSLIIGAALSERAIPIGRLEETLPAALNDSLILVLGNEGYGLPYEVLSLCSLEVCIPMVRGVDSLNVAVAGGILMYELFGER